MRLETMTSRQRVINTLRREPVDRMPIDLGGHSSTGISMFAYWNLREHLGLGADNIEVMDMVQATARVETDVLERFHADCILLEPSYSKTMIWQPRDRYRFVIPATAQPRQSPDGAWVIHQGERNMRMPPAGYFFDGAWLSDWGEGEEDDRYKLYAQEAERLYCETDYAVIFMGYSHGLGFHSFGGGSYQDAIMAYDEPEKLHEWRRHDLENSIRRMGKTIDLFGDKIQMVSIADDFGAQNGTLCSPQYIEEFSMPYYKRFCDFVHANSDIKVFLHSCGSVRSVLPMMIEAGIDVLNPVQISADNMSPDALKREFGDRIVFWGGGCDTQNVLARKSPAFIGDHVRKNIEALKPGGGFVFTQVHNIMGDVPPENIVAMFDTAWENSFYSQS